MRNFKSLCKQIKQWWQNCQKNLSLLFFDPYKINLNKKRLFIKILKIERLVSSIRKIHFSIILILIIIALTSVVGYRFYNQPQLAVGTPAPITIKAPRNAVFEDTKTTEEYRKAVRNGTNPILKHNNEINNEIKKELRRYLERIEKYRQERDYFPIVNTNILSKNTQEDLLQCLDWQWEKIVSTLEEIDNKKSEQVNNFNSQLQYDLLKPDYGPLKETIKKPITELINYQEKASQEEFQSLISSINTSRSKYAKTLTKISNERISQLSLGDKVTLLMLENEIWQQTKEDINRVLDRILAQGISQGLPPNLQQQTIDLQLESSIPQATQEIASKILFEILEPNLTIDEEETKIRAETAAQAVNTVYVEIEKGEVIVWKEEIITQEDFVLLDGFNLSRRGINWQGILLSALLVIVSITIFSVVGKNLHKISRRRDAILLFLLSISAPILLILDIPYTNLAAIGLLTSSFYRPTLGILQILLLTALMVFATEGVGWEFLLSGTAGGLLASSLAGRMHSREEQAVLGVGIGLTQGGVYLVINLILSAAAGTIWYAVLPRAILYGFSGVAWSIIALGISPYLESVFDLVTPIRLAELSNPNRPLLKRLATEAPGTFQHTMFVASLAEAAARELHCNVELVRAGTLYHDIGKMHDPLGFIENQMGGPNKHDLIQDPWVSTEIIRKHVTQGLVMARQYGLPKVIRDFIPEHQGTLLISYFYFQAKQRAEEQGLEPPGESFFRYAGPIPQSRESAIVMLADGCEAALRSLKDATPEVAMATVNKIFKARWRDNQLADSGLIYEELPVIAKVFVCVWQQCNHRRIAYPKGALEVNKVQPNKVKETKASR